MPTFEPLRKLIAMCRLRVEHATKAGVAPDYYVTCFRCARWESFVNELEPTRFDRLIDVSRDGLTDRQHTLLHGLWNALHVERRGDATLVAVESVEEFTGSIEQLDLLEEQISRVDLEKTSAAFFAQLAAITEPAYFPSECLRPWKDDEHPLATPYECAGCGSIEDDVKLEDSRTAYDTTCFDRFQFICRVGEENPNAPIPLCRSCAEGHHENWDEMWSDYQNGLF